MKRSINTSTFGENGAVIAEPIIEDGIAYVGACEKYFYALNVPDGRLLWEYKTGGVIMAPALIHENMIYFGCFDTYLHALSKDGHLQWKFKTGGIIAGKPAIHNGVLYFGSCDQYIYAVSLKTREVLWKFRTGDEVICDILIDDERICFGSQDGYFYCLGLDGSLNWKFRTGGSILLGAATATNDAIFFGSADQNLYAVGKDGTFKWGFRAGDMFFNAPVVFDGTVCIGSRDRYFYALDQKTGAIHWKFKTNDEVDFTTQIYDNKILVSSDKVYALDKKGNVIWSYQMPPYYISCGIAAENGVVIFGGFTGYVYGLDAKDGHLLWKFKTKSSTPPRARGLIAPPKWDPNIYDKFEPVEKEKAIKRVENFNPYVFDTLADDFFGQDKNKYLVGEEELNMYRAANEPGQYGEQKKRDRKKEEELVKITRTFFGN